MFFLGFQLTSIYKKPFYSLFHNIYNTDLSKTPPVSIMQILTIKMSILSFNKILNTVKLGHKLKPLFTDLQETSQSANFKPKKLYIRMHTFSYEGVANEGFPLKLDSPYFPGIGFLEAVWPQTTETLRIYPKLFQMVQF